MDVIELLGRVLFAAAFAITPYGVVKTAPRIAGTPMLAFLPQGLGVPVIRASAGSAVLGALLIALGLWPDLGALLVLAFLVPVTFVMHRFWELPKDPFLPRKQKRDAFLSNVSLAGGAVLLFALVNSAQDVGIAVLSEPLLGRI